MLHFGCMDYSKLTFPMPMTGGGILSGHIFAKVASAAGALHDKSARAIADKVNAPVATNGAALSSAYDYDYIAEWVNHRSDEVGLQLDFIDTITEIVDELRNVDRALRTDTFRAQMAQLEVKLAAYNEWFGFDPSGAASEPKYKIEHFVINDCRVFRTKARAPSLLTCVVRRDDNDLEWSMQTLIEQRNQIRRDRSVSNSDVPGVERITITDADDCRSIVGLFHRAEGHTVAKELAAAEGMLEHLSSSKNVAITIERARVGSADAAEAVASVRKVDRVQTDDLRLVSVSPVDRLEETTPSSRRNSRLASHAKTRSMSLIHQSKSIENELNSSFGVGVDSTIPGGESIRHSRSVPVNMSIDSPSPVHGLVEGEVNDQWDVGDIQDHSRDEMSDSSDAEGSARRISIGKSFIDMDDPQSSVRKVALSPNSAARAKEADAEEERLIAEVTKKVVASARALLLEGKISEKEFDTLINCDTRYRDEAARNEMELADNRLEECFGELWVEHKERILTEYVRKNPSKACSPHSSGDSLSNTQWPELDVRQFIVKSNDDLRQEVCCLQLIELCQEIFADVTSHGSSSKCDLWLRTYRICSTNATTGVVQVIPDCMSIDALKKTEGFVSIPHHFQKVYGGSPERLHTARQNFVASLAAYSVVCYIFQIKDRHNGNILLDREGHIIHIDFGFLLGIAPGGSFSIESAPFKLTEEMVDTFGGLDSNYFSDFLRAFTSGFLALRANSETIVSTLSLMSTQSTFPCFAGKDTNLIIDKLRSRFRTDLSVKDTVQHCLDLIIESYSHYGTKQYDNFQWLTNGIVQ